MNLQAYAEDLLARKITHEIHTSERRSFRGCRRRWRWVFVNNYYPPTTVRPLEFGVAFHAAMEVIFNPTTWRFPNEGLRALAEKTFVEYCERQRKAYLRAIDEYCLTPEEEENYDDRISLGRGMIQYFCTRQLPEIKKEYVPTHVEVSFDVPLYDEKGNHLLCKCKACRRSFARAGGGTWFGNPVVYSGRVDLVVHDMQGGYWLWDWKTATQLSDTEMYLELDDQVASYVWALRKKMGLNIRGFIYHEQRKAFPEPPNENKTTRLGRKFSVNANQATDYETYMDTVSTYDKDAYEAGLYDDFLEYLKKEGIVFYRKFTIYKSDVQLDNVGTDLTAEALDMIDPHTRIYPQPGRFSCSNCAFQAPCLSKNSGQDYVYTLQTLYVKQEPYYRRNRPLTTDKVGD